MTKDEIMRLADAYAAAASEHIISGASDADEARAALEAALTEKQEPDFCDNHCTWIDHHPDCKNAESKHEPVGEVVEDDFSRQLKGIGQWHKLPNGTKLYTHPAPVAKQEPDYWQQAYKMAQSLSDHLAVRPVDNPAPVNQQLLSALKGYHRNSVRQDWPEDLWLAADAAIAAAEKEKT